MCGVIGGVSYSHLNKSTCKKSLSLLSHRGPDYSQLNYHKNGRLFLGHSRLKIIDISDNSNQPFISSCGRYEIVFNGEIFNFQELKTELNSEFKFSTHGDTEVLLYLYKKYKYNMLDKINGMFAFCIYDKDEDELFIARDRFGIKQLYYYIDKNSFYFASEIKALLPFLDSVKENRRMIKTYLATSIYDFGEPTFFQDIKRLEASHYLVYDLKKLSLKDICKWYFIEKNINNLKYSQSDLEEVLYDKVDKAIKRHLIADVNVGLNVSGGLDSATLIYFTNKYLNDFHTFTQEYTNYSEKDWVKKATHEYAINSHFVNISSNDIIDNLSKVLEYEDEPFGGIAVIGYNFLYSLANKYNITVLLDGNGVDEIFLGYKKYHLEYLKDNINNTTLINEYCNFWHEDKNSVIKQISNMLNNQDMAIDGSLHKSSSISRNLLDLENYKIPNINVFDNRIKNLALQDLLYSKIPRGLRFNDRISMMHSKELRIPFLDFELVEFAYSLPMNQLINKYGTKAILRKMMSKKISKKVAFAYKRSIQTPQNDWLANEFRFLVEDILNSSSFKSRGWIDVNIAKKMYKEYLIGDKSNSFFIWQWINLELWARNLPQSVLKSV